MKASLSEHTDVRDLVAEARERGLLLDPEVSGDEVGFVKRGYRQRGFARFDDLTDQPLILRPFRYGWRRGANACFGDSGNPQTLGRSRLAVSLMHEHGEACAPPTTGQRLDVAEVRNFIDSFLN